MTITSPGLALRTATSLSPVLVPEPSSNLFHKVFEQGQETKQAQGNREKRSSSAQASSFQLRDQPISGTPANAPTQHIGIDRSLPATVINKLGQYSLSTARVIAYYNIVVKNTIEEVGNNNINNTPIDNDPISLLNEANEIHLRAAQPNATEEEKQASQFLTLEEARQWARNSDDLELLKDETKLVDAYKQAWSIQLTILPSIPSKTKDQLADEMAWAYANSLPVDASNTKYVLDPKGTKGSFSGASSNRTTRQHAYEAEKARLIAGSLHNGLDKAYYKQFADYFSDNQDPYTKAVAYRMAQDSGLSWSQSHQPIIKRAWTITDLGTLHSPPGHPNLINAFGINSKGVQGAGYLWETTSGDYQFLSPDGKIYSFGKQGPLDKNGNPSAGQIAKAMGAQDQNGAYGNGYSDGYYNIIYSANSLGDSDKSINSYLEKHLKEKFLSELNAFKEKGYSTTAGQKFLLAVVPFLQTIVNAANDPLSEPDVLSIVLDSLSLLITIGTAAASTIGAEGLVAIKQVLKGAASAATKAGQILSIIMKSLFSPKGAAIFSKEIADFIIPVSSAPEIVMGAGKLAVKGGKAVANAFKKSSKVVDGLGSGVKSIEKYAVSLPSGLKVLENSQFPVPDRNGNLYINIEGRYYTVDLAAGAGNGYRIKTDNLTSANPHLVEFKDGKWHIKPHSGLKGGAPIGGANAGSHAPLWSANPLFINQFKANPGEFSGTRLVDALNRPGLYYNDTRPGFLYLSDAGQVYHVDGNTVMVQGGPVNYLYNSQTHTKGIEINYRNGMWLGAGLPDPFDLFAPTIVGANTGPWQKHNVKIGGGVLRDIYLNGTEDIVETTTVKPLRKYLEEASNKNVRDIRGRHNKIVANYGTVKFKELTINSDPIYQDFYNALCNNIGEMYTRSPTFRQMFNNVVDKGLLNVNKAPRPGVYDRINPAATLKLQIKFVDDADLMHFNPNVTQLPDGQLVFELQIPKPFMQKIVGSGGMMFSFEDVGVDVTSQKHIYLGKDGQYRSMNDTNTIIHELSHAFSGLSDPPDGERWGRGATVVLANQIGIEMATLKPGETQIQYYNYYSKDNNTNNLYFVNPMTDNTYFINDKIFRSLQGNENPIGSIADNSRELARMEDDYFNKMYGWPK